MKIKLKSFQDKFLFSEKRFPALVAAIGTGKTMMLLLKIWNFCEKYPNTLALIVRKEYTDLRDSTIKDFERYFDKVVDSNKEYKFDNGSVIMFRHGSEINVLKNINLTIVGIEQAEEFETDEVFTFLRDRLRRDNAPLRQLCIIANTKGHNWIWKLWKNNPNTEEYDLYEATTFDNADVLPKDFVEDLKQMEIDAPNHYKQYVLNSWEDMETDDYLFDFISLRDSMELEFSDKVGTRALAVDVARFGDDETVFTVVENKGTLHWEQIYLEAHKHKDLMWTVGRFIDLRREFGARINVVDDDGIGGGVTDRLKQTGLRVETFKGGEKAKKDKLYKNKRSEGLFNLSYMITAGYLKILDDDTQTDQLLTIKYEYDSRNRKSIVSKDKMKKDGISSPDRADALMMVVYFVDKPIRKRVFEPERVKVY